MHAHTCVRAHTRTQHTMHTQMLNVILCILWSCYYRLVETIQHRIVTLYLPTHPISELSSHRIMRIDVSYAM